MVRDSTDVSVGVGWPGKTAVEDFCGVLRVIREIHQLLTVMGVCVMVLVHELLETVTSG
jgi:hypothetical protein